MADPMHQLLAAKGGVMGMDAVLSVVLVIPFKQQRVLRCCKRWLFVPVSNRTDSVATRTSTVVTHAGCDLSLPLVAAGRAFPLSPQVSASKRLLRCLGVFVMIPVSCLSRCLGSKRAVLTH